MISIGHWRDRENNYHSYLNDNANLFRKDDKLR